MIRIVLSVLALVGISTGALAGEISKGEAQLIAQKGLRGMAQNWALTSSNVSTSGEGSKTVYTVLLQYSSSNPQATKGLECIVAKTEVSRRLVLHRSGIPGGKTFHSYYRHEWRAGDMSYGACN